MHLASHMLTAITLSLLGTGLMSHALPINSNALGSKPESLTHPLTDPARPHFDSSNLIEREIHNADYGTAGKPQNASSVPSPKAESDKDKERRGKMRLMRIVHANGEEWNADQVADKDQAHKHRHRRQAIELPADLFHRIFVSDYYRPNPNSKENVALPSGLVVKPDLSIHSNGNNACDYYGYYPYKRMRHVHNPKYGSFSRFGDEGDLFGSPLSYGELSAYDTHAFRPTRRLSPTEGGFWVRTEVDGADVSGGGGSQGIRHFDPREVDKMTAVYALSHGAPVDNWNFPRQS